MNTLINDIKYAFRQLRKSPCFTTVAVLTLALGIGANTAIFSVINSVILRPLPYEQPDHLVNVWGNFTGIGLPDNRNAISLPEFSDIDSQNNCFSHVAVISFGQSFNLKIGDYPQRFEGVYVSPAFFPLLGVQAAAGRVFLPADGKEGQDRVVLISNGLWKRSFGADPAIVGKRVNINGISCEIVGVMPIGFQYPNHADLWAPFVIRPDDLAPGRRANHNLQVLARIKPELSLEQAQADMDLLTQAVINQNPDYPYARFDFAFVLSPLLDEMVGGIRKPLWILTGAVALVLLIACVNVANLLLARASARERDIAVQVALGANRARIFRQLLTESFVLSALGGMAGLIVAQGGLKILVYAGTTILPRVADVTLAPYVLTFTMLISLGSGFLFGLVPGLHATQEAKIGSLRGTDRSFTPDRGSRRLHHALIVVELALSLMLLSGAGLLVRSFLRVLAMDGGFRPENVLTMRISLPQSNYANSEKVRLFYSDLHDRVSNLPGVDMVGAIDALPLSGGGSSGTTTMDSNSVSPDQVSPEADQFVVTPGYFEAMGITLLSGRTFDTRDTDHSLRVVLIDETLAKMFWPGENAVGKRLHQGGAGGNPTWATIVGVVRHVRARTLEAQSRVQVYWPESQITRRSLTLVIRTKVEPHSLATNVQKEIAAIDPEQPAFNIRTMEELMQDSLASRRLAMLLLSIFAGVSLVLAAIGVYSIMVYWISQRTQEIGLRVALGAGQWDVLRLVVGEGFRLTGIGIVTGLAAAFFITRVLQSQLYGITTSDPLTYVVTATILGIVSMLACFIPARRAARVDPMEALRYE